MEFIGEGDRVMGLLFDLENLASPLPSLSMSGRQDERVLTYPKGACDLFNFSRGGMLWRRLRFQTGVLITFWPRPVLFIPVPWRVFIRSTAGSVLT
jgi:hypothetical protein